MVKESTRVGGSVMLKNSPRAFLGSPSTLNVMKSAPNCAGGGLATRIDLGPLAVATIGKGRGQTPSLTAYVRATDTGVEDKSRARHHPQRIGIRPGRVHGLGLGIGERAGASVAMLVSSGDDGPPFATFLIVRPPHQFGLSP